MRSTTMVAALVAGAALFSAAACGKGGEVTVGSGAGPTTQNRFSVEGTGRQLTKDQVKNAVLKQEDLPAEGWYPEAPDESTTDDSYFSTMEPTGCRDWFLSLPKSSKEWGVAESERVQFSKQGTGKTTILYTVVTHPDPQKVNDNVGLVRKGPEKCPSFELTDKKATVTGRIRPLEFQRPGDDSVATRLNLRVSVESSTAPASESYQDTLRVQVGHNLIIATVQSRQEVDEQQLKDILDKGFRRLEEAART